MDPKEFTDTVIKGDWSAQYELVKRFEKLTAQEKEKIADNLIDQLKKRSEQRILSILRFFRGHLYLYYLQESEIKVDTVVFQTGFLPKNSCLCAWLSFKIN